MALPAIAALAEVLADVLAQVVEMIVTTVTSTPEPTPESETEKPQDEAEILSRAETTLQEIREDYPQSLRADIQMKVLRNSRGEIYAIEYYSENPVVGYLEYGTGIYGPYKVKITPKFAKALHFKDRELARKLATPYERAQGIVGDDVFLKSVKGIPPRHAIAKALRRLKSYLPDWRIYSDRMEVGYYG